MTTAASPLISRLKFYHIQLTLCPGVTTRVCFDGTQKMFVRWKIKAMKGKIFQQNDKYEVDRNAVTNDGAK